MYSSHSGTPILSPAAAVVVDVLAAGVAADLVFALPAVLLVAVVFALSAAPPQASMTAPIRTQSAKREISLILIGSVILLGEFAGRTKRTISRQLPRGV